MTSILQFSDIHLGVEDPEAMAAVREMALSLAPDVSLICGDITQSGKVEEFKAAQEWIRTIPGPKVITPGNHDTPMFNIVRRLISPFGRYNKWIEPLSEPFYADKNVIIVSINTSRGLQFKLDWSLGVVDLEDLQTKIDQMNSAEAGTVKMIMCHHPLKYPPISPLQKETKRGVEALRILSDNNIDAVLTGHVHAPFFVNREPGATNILSIGSGTLSTRRRDAVPSFNHILIDETHIIITPIDWIDGRYVRREAWRTKRQSLSPAAA